jgi:hypothetical protein
MASSTSNLDTLTYNQAAKETTANALFDAGSPATIFGRRATTTTALTWGYYGGYLIVDGVLTSIANGTVALTASTTNYVEATRAGVVSKNATAFTAGSIPLYTIVTGASTVTNYTDHRTTWMPITGKLVKAMADANQTLTAAEARCQIIEAAGALTALRDVIVPLGAQQWTVFANVTGGFGVRVIGATGTGITIADTKRAIVYSDGTNVVRVSADV